MRVSDHTKQESEWTPDAPVPDSSLRWDPAERGSDVGSDHPQQSGTLWVFTEQSVDLHGLPPNRSSHAALVFAPVVTSEAQGLSAAGERLSWYFTRFTPPAVQTRLVETAFRCRCARCRQTTVTPSPRRQKLRSISFQQLSGRPGHDGEAAVRLQTDQKTDWRYRTRPRSIYSRVFSSPINAQHCGELSTVVAWV